MSKQNSHRIEGRGVKSLAEPNEEDNEDFNDDNTEEKKDIGDHIATIYTQIPHSVNDEMRDLATQMLKVEQKIVC